MRLTLTLAAFVLAATSLTAQERGAKALFLDTQTGRMVQPRVSTPAAQRTAAPRTPAVAQTQVPAVTGLMYYLERLQPDGQLTRVTSSTVFHSGERVRLHVTSNVDGSLVILQKQDQGPFERLLPSATVPASYASVRKGVDSVLPSADGWFKFDERPGEVQLLVMLVAATDVEGPSLAASAERRGAPMPSADLLQSTARAQRGSKALVVETTTSPAEAGEWHVVDVQRDRTVTPGQIVVEIKLQHRPRT